MDDLHGQIDKLEAGPSMSGSGVFGAIHSVRCRFVLPPGPREFGHAGTARQN
jgi:hypothetical protein